jgi:hypothetical protein
MIGEEKDSASAKIKMLRQAGAHTVVSMDDIGTALDGAVRRMRTSL